MKLDRCNCCVSIKKHDRNFLELQTSFNESKASLSRSPCVYTAAGSSFPVCLWLSVEALYMQPSTFPLRLKQLTAVLRQSRKERPYLCKLVGNLPRSFQHTGTCSTLTRAPSLRGSLLQHLCSLNSLSVSPSTCQRQPATDCQHIQIPAASRRVFGMRAKCPAVSVTRWDVTGQRVSRGKRGSLKPNGQSVHVSASSECDTAR